MPKGVYKRIARHLRANRRNLKIAWGLPRTRRQLRAARRTIRIAWKSPKYLAAAGRNVKLAQRAALESPKTREAARKNVKIAQRAALLSKKRKNGYCEICKRHCFLNKDHCHRTGKRRGKLCLNCNLALGLLKDNLNSLKSAIEYLKRFK